ncbi:DsbA family protein [Patescibacteria group bacterium]|nr:DsbA family protein [Patescibacteria group bacterium]
MNEKLYLPISVIIGFLIIAGAIVYTKSPQQSFQSPGSSASTGSQTQPGSTQGTTITEQNHIRGDFEAPVTIVEFSDYECPFCSRFHPTVQQILADYSGQVRWVYKHFPLDQIHAQARPAAEASECIWEQKGNDGFWQFSDGLFENQARLGNSFYKELAAQIGVNADQFNDCVSSRKYKDKVEADYQEGIKAGIRGTPGSFVNGQSIPGAVPYSVLKATVDQALADLE